MFYHVTPLQNLESIFDYGLIPLKGERSVACGEETPAVYLFNSLEDVDTALASWLGEELEDIPLAVVLEVKTESAIQSETAEFEFISTVRIPPENLRVHHIETE